MPAFRSSPRRDFGDPSWPLDREHLREIARDPQGVNQEKDRPPQKQASALIVWAGGIIRIEHAFRT
jgi:hypothetical protein